MLELIEQTEMAADELIDIAGRAAIGAVLTFSAIRDRNTARPNDGRRPGRLSSATSPGSLGGLGSRHPSCFTLRVVISDHCVFVGARLSRGITRAYTANIASTVANYVVAAA